MNNYLDKALEVLEKYMPTRKTEHYGTLVGLLEEVMPLDEVKVAHIANTIRHTSHFNELVRINLEQIEIGHRYEKIAELFDSIRDDSKVLINQLQDGKISFSEKAGNLWMKIVRGAPHERFEKIKDIYKDVTKETKNQLDREIEIISGYIDFRFALKDSEIHAGDLLEIAEANLKESKDKLKVTQDAYSKDENSTNQMARDEAKREVDDKDRQYQLLKDLTENLQTSYNVGDTLIMKLKQTHDIKDRVYRRAVGFFTTNEHVFTVLDAVYTSQHGLNETTQATQKLKEGLNKGLEDISDLGRGLEKAALEAGYGSTVSPASVQKLVDSIVNYQNESVQLIEDLRKESTESTAEINKIVEEGKKKVIAYIDNYNK